ncbi:LysR family transcriptional regulator [Collimonas sp.]|jgi:DNA-binding transcriptional LysR family regulator|uniref:LysR family transcriptional regulator n=1 Tax=Collimonas sp. TaxID=1963772 RepID=UPI002BC4874C|nr:LysR family transcriptional regulator [Collimonas sp.]HWW07561.1 LysR family transcriptional regulator [Collimonas sp.]
MDRFHLMSVFVAVAEEQSFAAAARRLQMSPPAVTRAILALENRLGVKLLNRTTRYVRATDAGLRYLEDARRIMAEADEADEAAAGVNAEPRGQLTVTAPVLFGRMFVMPSMVDYLQRFPAMAISALFADRVVNFLEEGIDVGIRIGELADSSMKAIQVGQVSRVVCAAPAYLATHGAPATPEQLAGHTVIASTAVAADSEWRFINSSKPGGKQISNAKIRPRITVSSNDAAIEAALHGFGVTRLLSYQIAPYLDSGQLQIVLADYQPASVPVHVLHREGRLASAKVRSFVDLLVDSLRGNQALR